MEEGNNVKNGRPRWQVIVKTPYQNLGDELVVLYNYPQHDAEIMTMGNETVAT